MSESLKYAAEVYKNQPGRIENYEPGKSSISEKEAKQVGATETESYGVCVSARETDRVDPCPCISLALAQTP